MGRGGTPDHERALQRRDAALLASVDGVAKPRNEVRIARTLLLARSLHWIKESKHVHHSNEVSTAARGREVAHRPR